jgi:hypothetical protein
MQYSTTRFNDRVKLEERLNNLKFNDLPVGSLLAYPLMQAVQWTANTGKKRASAKFKFFLNFLKGSNIKYPVNKVWIVPVDTSERITDLMMPVIRSLDESSFLVTQPLKGFPDINFPIIPKLNFSQWYRWFAEYRRVFPLFKKFIHEELPAYLTQSHLLSNLSLEFIIQTQRAVLYEDIVKASKPAAILVDFDRQYVNSVLTVVGNKHKVRTFTLIHGSTYPPYGYLPVIAQKCLCWGMLQKNQFEKYGTQDGKMVIAGNPKFTGSFNISREEAKRKLNVEKYNKIAVWGNNPLHKNVHLDLVKDFVESFQYSDCLPVIKLHPVDSKEDFIKAIDPSCNYLVIQNEYMLDEILSVTDILFTHSSTIAVDAIVKKIPVAIYNPIDMDAGIGNILRDEGNTPYITSKDSLNTFMQECAVSDISAMDFMADQAQFLENFCAYLGEDSARVIVRNLVKSNAAQPEFQQ